MPSLFFPGSFPCDPFKDDHQMHMNQDPGPRGNSTPVRKQKEVHPKDGTGVVGVGGVIWALCPHPHFSAVFDF